MGSSKLIESVDGTTTLSYVIGPGNNRLTITIYDNQGRIIAISQMPVEKGGMEELLINRGVAFDGRNHVYERGD